VSALEIFEETSSDARPAARSPDIALFNAPEIDMLALSLWWLDNQVIIEPSDD